MSARDVVAARRWFAEDLRVRGHLTSRALVEAFATVPRERFLGPGPWVMRGPYEGGPYTPAETEPTLVYHDVAIALDPSRDLYNGQPGLIARWIEDLAIPAGARVVHIGSGTGYFTAILGEIVGSTGTVWATEIDAALADRAARNLADWPWIGVTRGDGRTGLLPEADVVLVHAGATHVLDEWLDALAVGGRLLVPLTGAMPAMGPHLGKGVMLRVTRTPAEWRAQVSSFVAIYSLVGARDDAMDRALGQALLAGTLGRTTHLRRDAHGVGPTCLLHGPTTCLSS